MTDKRIQLTEQDLHMLVEDAVKSYLINEGIEEDGKGKIQGAVSWWRNRKKAQAQPKTADQGVTQPVNTGTQPEENFFQKAGRKFLNAGEKFNDFRASVRRGGANGDAQKCINNAVAALNDLLEADKVMTANGGVGIGNAKARRAVQNALSYLNASVGGYNMRNRFNSNIK